ncbi:MAG: cobyric acid synthase [Candidatus Methanofastidiosa archaeon]|nr:cobyric acid synthase [Candidatus Methanofastidiosa archaeon]
MSQENLTEEVKKQFKNGIIGSNRSCEYYPCHFDGQDCTFCYCPFYRCNDPFLGKEITSKKGNKIWSCKDCFWIHRNDIAKKCFELLEDEYFNCSEDEILSIKKTIETSHHKYAKTIMILGATSGAGKSLTVAALCRILSNRGYKVAPFKSQNMSLNSFVTEFGEEIASIQDLQAKAARIKPRAYMNPILLKPKKDNVSQVVIEGKPYKDMDVEEYYSFTRSKGLEIVRSNLHFLRRLNDVVVIEGAGSPTEINIRDSEIANMKTAEIADAPCILVVNIEWGGSFAYIYGTLNLLHDKDRKRFKGVIINNLRGDKSSLHNGIEEIERLVGVPVLGIVPHIELNLPMEDSMFIKSEEMDSSKILIGVIKLPRISNFTDFDALDLEKNVSVIFIDDPTKVKKVDAIIIPGTKNTVEDLKWLKQKGFFESIKKRSGSIPIIGICGGYQMLGKKIIDKGMEGEGEAEYEGLDLLDVSTYFDLYDKKTVQVNGKVLEEYRVGDGLVRGYEIHTGKTITHGNKPIFQIYDVNGTHFEGCIDTNLKVMGTYIHGIFDLPSFRKYFLSLISKKIDTTKETYFDYNHVIDLSLEKLAKTFEENIDMHQLCTIIGLEDSP